MFAIPVCSVFMRTLFCYDHTKRFQLPKIITVNVHQIHSPFLIWGLVSSETELVFVQLLKMVTSLVMAITLLPLSLETAITLLPLNLTINLCTMT